MNDLDKQLVERIHELIPEAELIEECHGHKNFKPKDTIGLQPCYACNNTGIIFEETFLRHVLWALDDSGTYVEDPKDDKVYRGVCYVLVNKWNLQHNLYGQSDELKKWLLNLLSNG